MEEILKRQAIIAYKAGSSKAICEFNDKVCKRKIKISKILSISCLGIMLSVVVLSFLSNMFDIDFSVLISALVIVEISLCLVFLGTTIAYSTDIPFDLLSEIDIDVEEYIEKLNK